MRTYSPDGSCAQYERERAVLERLRDTLTGKQSGGRAAIATILRCWIEECPGVCWANRDIAAVLRRHERSVRRARRSLHGFPDLVLVESEEHGPRGYRGNLRLRRWVRPRVSTEGPGGRTPRDGSSSWTADPVTAQGEQRETSHVDPDRSSEIEQQGQIGDPPASPSGSTHPRTHERARGARAPSSRDRAPHRERRQPPPPRPRIPKRLAQRVAVEVGVWRALRDRYGLRAMRILQTEVHFEHYHRHVAETALALRTCLESTPQTPGDQGVLRMFRGLFREALRGEQLIDKAAQRAAGDARAVDDILRAGPAAEAPADAWCEFLDSLDERLVRVRSGDPEHAELLEEAIRRARESYRAAVAREGHQRDRDIAREVTRNAGRQALEELVQQVEQRLAAADRAVVLETRAQAQMRAYPDDELERYARMAGESVMSAERRGEWRAAEHARELLRKYLAEVERRQRCARVTPDCLADDDDSGSQH